MRGRPPGACRFTAELSRFVFRPLEPLAARARDTLTLLGLDQEPFLGLQAALPPAPPRPAPPRPAPPRAASLLPTGPASACSALRRGGCGAGAARGRRRAAARLL